MFDVAYATYDTRQNWATHVANALSTVPNNVVDLGSGAGNLLAALMQRGEPNLMIAAERCELRVSALRTRLPQVFVVQADLLKPWPARLKQHLGSLQAGICNPPFLRLHDNAAALGWLKREKIAKHWVGSVPSALVFLAQNLALLENGGELSIVLPDSLLSLARFAPVRAALFERHAVQSISALHPNAFHRAEAHCHVVTLRKAMGTTRQVVLTNTSNTTRIVEVEKLVIRADPSFHCADLINASENCLEDIGAQVRRGTHTKREMDAYQGLIAIHSSDIAAHHGRAVHVNKNQYLVGQNALPGDILIARVGTRVVGKVAYFASGNATISDCVIRLRVPARWRKLVFQNLASDVGQLILQRSVQGVGARFLTHEDILKFPLSAIRAS